MTAENLPSISITETEEGENAMVVIDGRSGKITLNDSHSIHSPTIQMPQVLEADLLNQKSWTIRSETS